MRTIARAAAATAALAALIGAAAAPAEAGIKSDRTGTVATVSSATWGVTPTTPGGTPVAGTVINVNFTFVLIGGLSGPQYFDVVNTGTKTLVATTYKVAITTGGLVLGSVTINLTACSTGWNTSANTCTGTKTAIAGGFAGSNGSTVTVDSTVAPLTVGQRMSFQATVSGLSVIGSVGGAISTLVNSSSPRDLTAASTTNR